MPGPLEVTTLLLYEFRQAVRFQIRLNRHDPTKGYPKAEGVKMLGDLKSNLVSGDLMTIPAPWPQVHLAAERLSELHTDAGGHRSLDILHVATAIELGARGFLTFDEKQKKLARISHERSTAKPQAARMRRCKPISDIDVFRYAFSRKMGLRLASERPVASRDDLHEKCGLAEADGLVVPLLIGGASNFLVLRWMLVVLGSMLWVTMGSTASAVG